MDDILLSWKTLNLTENEEKEVDIRNNVKESFLSSVNIQLCTVAKVLTSKKVNVEAFRAVMISVWMVHKSTKIELAGDNIFVIQFRSMLEKSRVLVEGPWTFDRALIILQSPKDVETIGNMKFSKTSIWIQIHNVPFNCLTRDMAKILGEKIGTVEDIDSNDCDVWSGPFMRIRVVIDIEKPLQRGLKLRVSDTDFNWCPIMYEKLPDFCHTCGVIGHSQRECQAISLSGKSADKSNYGDWLRATILKRNNGSRWVSARINEDAKNSKTPSHGISNNFNRWGGTSRSDTDRWKPEHPSLDGEISNVKETAHGLINVEQPIVKYGETSSKQELLGNEILRTDGIIHGKTVVNQTSDLIAVGSKEKPNPLDKIDTTDELKGRPGKTTSEAVSMDECLLMDLEKSGGVIFPSRQKKKYKVKIPLPQTLGEDIHTGAALSILCSKRKSEEEVEDLTVVKKCRMEDPTSNLYMAEAVEQPCREL